MIALAEISLAPILLIAGLGDFGKLFILFPYYRFLVFRYISRRNPYNRKMFEELKNTAVRSVNLPQCPTLLRTCVYKAISLISSLAPVHEHPN